jgi:hypothetical protein
LTPSISFELRKFVTERADNRCEYCLIPQSFCLHKHEPDHIIPIQHGSLTVADNLALACMRCNRYKGPNIGFFDPETGKLVPFFNPRNQEWTEHFKLEGAVIRPLTAEGRVTVKIFRINDEKRLEERKLMIQLGLFLQSHRA